MALLLENHIDVDLSEFTLTSGTDITCDANAAMGGSLKGMQILIDDTTADYGREDIADASGTVRVRFYYDPNGWTNAGAAEIALLYINNSGGEEAMSVRAQRTAGGIHQIFMRAKDDAAASHDSASYTIDDCPHYIEALLTKSSGANDGVMTLWIDGVQMYTKVDLDNDTRFDQVNRLYLGKYTVTAGTSGAIYLDELVVRNDNTEIGPYINPANGAILWGYNVPDHGESPVPWPEWDDGAAGAVTVTGDANWGKLNLIMGAEGRSEVIDLGDANPRTYTLEENHYGTGQEAESDTDLQYRGDINPFVQDDVAPAWTTYTVPFTESWRYIQIREHR